LEEEGEGGVRGGILIIGGGDWYNQKV